MNKYDRRILGMAFRVILSLLVAIAKRQNVDDVLDRYADALLHISRWATAD